MDTSFDVIVVGAGHAGCEAGLAAARLGCRTLVLTVSLDNVAFMPCNPSVGGPGKGHLVREIDALGGEMGRAVDRASLQIRLLNTAKGRAVRALRAQADKRLYHQNMKAILEREPNLFLREGMVTEVLVVGGRVEGVKLRGDQTLRCGALVLATGTFLESTVHIGQVHYSSGPAGAMPSNELPGSLRAIGMKLRRFKTGTSPRVNGCSIRYEGLERIDGDALGSGFSFWEDPPERPHRPCWSTHTTGATANLIRDNLEKSALFGGAITGVGPRYCPSIESKIVEFPGRESHPVFIEPESAAGEEMYLSGLSTSLPFETQWGVLATIPGLEEVEIMRPGYAIEYDVIDSTRLKSSLEDREIGGLFCAGQLNGSSGYEEAAAQGLMAGINAALMTLGRAPLVINRWEGYIGVMIDDLTVKGVTDPYRMLTARAEHRLLLREGNADLRLTELGHRAGMVDEQRYTQYARKKSAIEDLIRRLENQAVPTGADSRATFAAIGTPEPSGSLTLADLLRRPEVGYEHLRLLDPRLPEVPPAVEGQVEEEIKYSGYIAREMLHVERRSRHENRRIPERFDYAGAHGLSREAREKLAVRQPATLGEASRVPGISPADVAVLEVLLATRDATPMPDQPEGGEIS